MEILDQYDKGQKTSDCPKEVDDPAEVEGSEEVEEED